MNSLEAAYRTMTAEYVEIMPEHVVTYKNPETMCEVKDKFENLSGDAKIVVSIVVFPPHGTELGSKKAIQAFLKKKKWKRARILKTFRELTKFALEIDDI